MRKFLEALVYAAFDRIESSVPPCVEPEDATDLNAVSYRHGIAETVGATFQCLLGNEEWWAIADLLKVSHFHETMQDFVNVRIGDKNAPVPEATPIIDRLLKAVGEPENV